MILTFKGRAIARLYENGVQVDQREAENFITEAGEALIADRLSDRDDTDGDFSHIGVGTGTGQSRTSTDLATPLVRVALSTLDQGTGADDNDVICEVDIAAGTGTGNISEAGIFNELGPTPPGTMLNYVQFDPAIPKAAGQNLVITFTITCGAS